MYILKEQSEDFQVEEIPLDDMLCEEPTKFHIYLLEKQNYTSERAIQQVARSLNIPRKRISYAGTKDKQAITKQYISLQGVNKERVAQLQLKDLTLQFVGYSKQPLGLGVLEGNKFLITIRNLDKEFSLPSLPETFLVPNYFDEQRFSRNNKPVGLFILQRKFDLAVARVLKYDDDYRIILQEHLEKHERDFVGALRKLPRRSLLFYVHAVQSFFFNEILREQLISKIPDARLIDYSEGVFAFPKEPFMSNPLPDLPLPGFFLTDKLSEEILVKHDLTKDSFILRQIPELSLEGQNRAACMSVMDFKADSLEDDELHENKKKIKISFSLTKGSYATVVIRQVIAAIKPN